MYHGCIVCATEHRDLDLISLFSLDRIPCFSFLIFDGVRGIFLLGDYLNRVMIEMHYLLFFDQGKIVPPSIHGIRLISFNDVIGLVFA